MFRKSIVVFLVLTLTLFTFVGCNQETSQPSQSSEPSEPSGNEDMGEEKEAQVLIYNFEDNPTSLDPGIAEENVGINVLCNTYEGLIKIDDAGNPVPAIAKKWDVNEDSTEYTFFLREDAKWSDGKPVTAHDFVYAWKRAADPETASQFAYFFYYLKNGEEIVEGNISPEELGVEAVNDTTLKVTLESPISYIFNIFAFSTYFPVREDIISADPDRWTLNGKIVSNGPFIVNEWKQNEEIILLKNENYWNAEEVKLDEIRLQFIKEAATALAAFEAGQIDGSMLVPPTEIPRLLAESDEFRIYPALRNEYLEFNTKAEPFDDIRVRKAFTLAINRKDITSKVTLGGEKPAVGVVPFGIKLGGEDFREVGGTYDIDPNNAKIEEAKKLLAEAGYPDGEGLPPIKLNIRSGSNQQRVAEALVEMWKNNLGLTDIELLPQEAKVHYDDLIAGNYQVGTASWGADYAHPMTFLDMWMTGSGFNETGYYNEEFDELIKKAKLSMDVNKSVEYMHQAEDLWMSQYAVCPLYFLGGPDLMKSYVKDIVINATSVRYFDKAYIEGKNK